MNRRGAHFLGLGLAASAAVAAAVLLPLSASAAPVVGDGFWTTDDDGTVLSVAPTTGAWTVVGTAAESPYFRGMDVDPLTGIGYAVADGEAGTQLYATDVAAGTQTPVGPVLTAGDAGPVDCFALDLTAGVLSAVCDVDADGVSTWFGTIDPATQRFTPLTALAAPAGALAVKEGIATIIDGDDDVWTLPVGGGIPLLVGTVAGTSGDPEIIAADYDSAGTLWVVDAFIDPMLLAELDASFAGVSSVELMGPEGEQVYTGTLAITWAAPPAPGLPGTGSSIVPQSILLIVSLFAITFGAGVLVSRRPQEG